MCLVGSYLFYESDFFIVTLFFYNIRNVSDLEKVLKTQHPYLGEV